MSGEKTKAKLAKSELEELYKIESRYTEASTYGDSTSVWYGERAAQDVGRLLLFIEKLMKEGEEQ